MTPIFWSDHFSCKASLNRKPYTLVGGLILILLLGACASLGERNAFTVPPGAKVGIINLIDSQLTHVTVGTTVFNNSIRSHATGQFDFPGMVQNEIVKMLTERGFHPVRVEAPDSLRKDELALGSTGWNGYRLTREYKKIFSEVLEEEGLDYLLVLDNRNGQDSVTGSSFHFGGHGLYTRSFFGSKKNFVYSNLWVHGVSPDPNLFIGYPGADDVREVDFSEVNDASLRELKDILQDIISKKVADMPEELGL